MEELESRVLKSFKKYEGKEVEKLDLIVLIDPENWEEERTCEVMEKRDNGRVWTCYCTRNGKIKETYEL